jgi:hypothetical protein
MSLPQDHCKGGMRKIFISHSSKDAEQAELVLGWLQQNNYEAFLDSDKNLGIVAGTGWSEQLRISLNECRILIAICSQHYRESDWCRYEMDVAYHRCLTIIPILIDDSPLLGILKPTQCISLQKGLQDAQTRLLNGIRQHLASDLDLGWDAKRRPYPGLDPFNENDELIFYGREDEIEETVRHLRTIRRERDHCLHLVIGASGSGKSSLVRAGVIPRLKRDQEAWIVLPPFHPGSEPLQEWASSIVTALSCYNLPRQQEEILQSLQTDPERTIADLVETFRTQSGAQEASLLVTIDQFEELLELRPDTTADSPRQQFVQTLKNILECKTLAGRLVVIGTLRSDFLDVFQEARYFQSNKSRKQILAPMSRKNFRQVIEKPAELAGIEIEEKLIDAMVEDTETGDALPLLAFTLRELWEKKTEHRQARGAQISINLSDYQQIGGLGGAIQQRAEQIYQDYCSPDQQIQLRDCLLRMVRSNADIDQVGWVKRAALWSEMPPESHAVLDRFVSARLLVKKKANSAPQTDSPNAAHEDLLIEPTHEALLRNWKRLEEWIREDNDFLLWRDRFNSDYINWQRSASLNKDYLEGSKLLEAEKWKDKFPSNSSEKLFIQTSIRHRRSKTLAWYALLSGLLAGLAYSLNLWQNAEEAQAYQYKIRQATTAESDPYESGIAGLAAMGRFFLRPGLNYQIARSLEQTITATLAGTPQIATQFSSIDAITTVSEQRLVVSGTQGQVAALQLIELAADGSPILQGQPSLSKMTRIKSLLANPEHSLLYSLGYADEGILLGEWSIAEQRLIPRKQQTVFPGEKIFNDTLALIPGPGQDQEPLLLAWAEGDGRDTLLVWSGGKISKKFEGVPPATAFLALDDGTLISAHERGPLRTWKRIASNGKTQLLPEKQIDTADIKVVSLTHFARDNQKILIAGGNDGSLIVIRDGKVIQKIDPTQTRQIGRVSVAALNTGEVISGDQESRIRWWTWQSIPGGKGALIAASESRFDTGQQSIQSLVAISLAQQPSGNVLSAGADGSLRLLSQEPYALGQPLYPHQNTSATPAALSALTAWQQGGLASGYADGSICWWVSLADSQKLPTPRCQRLPEGERITALATLGSEQQLFSASKAGTNGYLRLWKDQTVINDKPSTPIQAMLLLNNTDLVTGDDQGALQWWTSRGNRKGSAIPSGADPVRLMIALDSNNVVSVSGIPDQLGWWKNGTLRSLRQDPTQQSRLTSISRWSGRDVITGGSSGLIQQWRDGKRIGDPIPTDHTEGVWAMLKLNSPPLQSGVLLTAGENGQIGVWNAGLHTRERGSQPAHETINTGQGKIISLLETKPGDLISGSADGSIKITSPSKVVRAACQLYKPIMNQPSTLAEQKASELCSCPPPDQWWNVLQWLCFRWKLIS